MYKIILDKESILVINLNKLLNLYSNTASPAVDPGIDLKGGVDFVNRGGGTEIILSVGEAPAPTGFPYIY